MDLRKLKKLIDLVQESGIAELEITEGDEKVKISRNLTVSPMTQPVVSKEATFVPLESNTRESVVEKESTPSPSHGTIIKSPMVGTFYRAGGPDDKAFVEIGEKVEVGTILCIIEAMKLMNEIESEASGTISEIFVENGQAVEYGQKLFRID